MTASDLPPPSDMPAADADDPRVAAIVMIDAALGQIRRSMVRRGLGRRVIDDLGLAVEPAVTEVIDVVAEAIRAEPEGIPVGAVAARLAVDPSQASRLVADAVQAGYLARFASASDGRRSLLRLTPAGEAIIEAMRGRKRELLLEHVEDWNDSELSTFAALLQRFSGIAGG
jgi:DNA-binding MarR family transcriptional regulator